MQDTNKDGPHISVISNYEVTKYKLPPISEKGNNYTFKVINFSKSLNKHCLNGSDDDRTWYVLIIESLDLDNLREKYGLPMHHTPFHISLGYQDHVNTTPCTLKPYEELSPN
jgi:hypothetical protein